MNPLNYATLEASKRLHDAGIALNSEAVWIHVQGGSWYLRLKDDGIVSHSSLDKVIPAPSMAEVWRELPDDIDGHELGMGKEDGESYVFYKSLKDFPYNTNPTDALIDLLIWVRSERGRR